MRLAVAVPMLLLARLASAQIDYTTPGPLPVGVTRLLVDKISETTGEPRVLATQVWYPAKAGTGTAEGPFLRDADVAEGRASRWSSSRTGPAASRTNRSFLMEALASRGFIVAAPPHPGNTFGGDCRARRTSPTPTRTDRRTSSSSPTASSHFGRDAASRFHRHVKPKRLGVAGTRSAAYDPARRPPTDRRFKAALALAPVLPAEQDSSSGRRSWSWSARSIR